MNNKLIYKIWGFKIRLLETATTVVDILTLKRGGFCSWHYHDFKYNLFIVLSGRVLIETEDYTKVLLNNDYYAVEPKMKHRFIAKSKAKLIEVMYTNPVLEDDIIRLKQGGLIINNDYITEDEIKQKDKNANK
jgi:mannose-6-phosphate isomerase-like protein (cupin superfamily)